MNENFYSADEFADFKVECLEKPVLISLNRRTAGPDGRGEIMGPVDIDSTDFPVVAASVCNGLMSLCCPWGQRALAETTLHIEHQLYPPAGESYPDITMPAERVKAPAWVRMYFQWLFRKRVVIWVDKEVDEVGELIVSKIESDEKKWGKDSIPDYSIHISEWLVKTTCMAKNANDAETYLKYFFLMQQLFAREFGGALQLDTYVGPRNVAIGSAAPYSAELRRQIGATFERYFLCGPRAEVVDLGDSDTPKEVPACGYHNFTSCVIMDDHEKAGTEMRNIIDLVELDISGIKSTTMQAFMFVRDVLPLQQKDIIATFDFRERDPNGVRNDLKNKGRKFMFLQDCKPAKSRETIDPSSLPGTYQSYYWIKADATDVCLMAAGAGLMVPVQATSDEGIPEPHPYDFDIQLARHNQGPRNSEWR